MTQTAANCPKKRNLTCSFVFYFFKFYQTLVSVQGEVNQSSIRRRADFKVAEQDICSKSTEGFINDIFTIYKRNAARL